MGNWNLESSNIYAPFALLTFVLLLVAASRCVFQVPTMEHLTWPRGSGGHVFSTIPSSDHDESSGRHRRKESFRGPLPHNESSSSGRLMKCNVDNQRSDSKFQGHRYHNHRQRHHGGLLRHERDSGGGVDQRASALPRFLIRKRDEKQDHAQTRKSHDFSNFCGSGKKKQDMSFNHIEINGESNKNKASMASVPSTTELNRFFSSTLAEGYRFNREYQIHKTSKFSMLPDDILLRVMASFSWKDLWSASMVCRAWCQALAPLREGMHFVHWGKRFKHGRGGISQNLDKALHSFLNGAKRGCTAAMVDAGLLLWETGHKEEGIYWYKQAAQLGDPAGQCNLGLAFLQDPNSAAQAVKWFYEAALAGHVRAQYSLALCLQQGRGVNSSIVNAVRWYHRAAEGGNARAMYNLALCYRKGEGLVGDTQNAKKWMKRAALAGHQKAQFEHGLTLFAENEGGLALVFLELATRAGETVAIHLRDALMQQLSPKMRAHAISCADKWQAKLSARN